MIIKILNFIPLIILKHFVVVLLFIAMGCLLMFMMIMNHLTMVLNYLNTD